ncbi:enoyl-CoA hydratase/isomerase family protein [Actinomycetospora sp. TBRC 11914]|uniref:enoyl-CoA hydratase/isomerase family protein n=1 Tax=Actinomycetospora sp. TBRC 11914 TaxID=2729387 RepID=UPI00145F412B|nr:enoyl-CoA hydratase-related protein [Actinomycetospora sp. TBRC 11914]NMO93887.1 enoyl-CoA hydratase [Actinomycetospora sp. TBRC 11914]
MTDEVVTWTREDRVVVVRLAAPPVNALSAAVVAGLERALDAFDSSDARVLVITSDVPGFFVAGADLKAMADFAPEDFGRYLEALRRPIERIAAADRPSIAVVEGQALGGGLELAMAASLRVAGRDARLGLPETRLGLVPGAGGTQRLPRLVGRGRALDLMLTPRTVNAAEAHAIGLVDRLVDAGGAEEAARAWAAGLAALPTSALGAVLRCVDDAHDLPLAEGLAREADRVGELFAGEDAREGVAAFLAHRPPEF